MLIGNITKTASICKNGEQMFRCVHTLKNEICIACLVENKQKVFVSSLRGLLYHLALLFFLGVTLIYRAPDKSEYLVIVRDLILRKNICCDPSSEPSR